MKENKVIAIIYTKICFIDYTIRKLTQCTSRMANFFFLPHPKTAKHFLESFI